jgi:C2 domain
MIDSALSLNRGQIIVQILEAKELKSLLMQGRYAYCKVVLTAQDKALFQDYTYRTDETTNPLWMNQLFLINVPETAASSQSKVYMLSITVHSSSLFGVDRFLGRVDIPLGVLKSQERMKGWFALRPNASSIKYSTNTLKVSGSLKLSVQWVYSMDGLAHSLRRSTEKRLDVLKNLNDVNLKCSRWNISIL